MSAGASPTKSPESLQYSLAEKPTDATSLSAVPPVLPSVKTEIEPKRVLLLASEAVFESEVRAALERQHRSGQLPLFFDLVYLDLTSDLDFCSVLDLLAYVRQGFF